MTTKEIQQIVQMWLYDRSNIYQALNYGKSGYYEADVLGVTPSRIVTEVEVKISRSDFQADFKKKYKHYRMQNPSENINWKTPNRFWYACKLNLIRLNEIPSYAGLIYICDDNVCMIAKDAPLLHRNKCDDKLIIGMLRNLTAKTIFGKQKMSYDADQRKIAFENRLAR